MTSGPKMGRHCVRLKRSRGTSRREIAVGMCWGSGPDAEDAESAISNLEMIYRIVWRLAFVLGQMGVPREKVVFIWGNWLGIFMTDEPYSEIVCFVWAITD